MCILIPHWKEQKGYSEIMPGYNPKHWTFFNFYLRSILYRIKQIIKREKRWKFGVTERWRVIDTLFDMWIELDQLEQLSIYGNRKIRYKIDKARVAVWRLKNEIINPNSKKYFRNPPYFRKEV